MVVRCLIPLIAFAFAGTAWTMTADELRALTGEAEQAKRVRAQRVQGSDLSTVLKRIEAPEKAAPTSKPKPTSDGSASGISSEEKPVSNPPPPSQPPTASKHTQPKAQPSAVNAPATGTARVRASDPHVYIPPPRGAQTANAGVSDAVEANQSFYGIRLGTFIPVELRRDANSAEPGLIELHVTADVVGDRRTLERGTQLFAQGTFNEGNSRFDGRVVRAITPGGRELKINGLVFDAKRVAGVAGAVPEVQLVENAQRGMERGVLAAGAEVLSATNGVGGAFINEAGQEVLRGEQQRQRSTQPQRVVYISPQQLYVRVEDTF